MSETEYESSVTETESSRITEPSVSSKASTAESSMENSILTSEDWKKMQSSLAPESSASGSSNKKAETGSGATGEFDKIKSDKSKQNDAWVYLAIGIPLIVLGAGLVAAVIIVNTRANKKLKEGRDDDDEVKTDEIKTDEGETDENNIEEDKPVEEQPAAAEDDSIDLIDADNAEEPETAAPEPEKTEVSAISLDAFRAAKESRSFKNSEKLKKGNDLDDTLDSPVVGKSAENKDNEE